MHAAVSARLQIWFIDAGIDTLGVHIWCMARSRVGIWVDIGALIPNIDGTC